MLTIITNLVLIVTYVLGGVLLEHLTQEPAIYAFYGYMSALLAVAANTYLLK